MHGTPAIFLRLACDKNTAVVMPMDLQEVDPSSRSPENATEGPGCMAKAIHVNSFASIANSLIDEFKQVGSTEL